MITGENYINTVGRYFSFLVTEFGYSLPKITENGNAFYDMEYISSKNIISISYENIEDYLQVIVFKLINGQLPDYDDKTHTLHLSELNKLITSKVDKEQIEKNAQWFKDYKYTDAFERKLLKSAKDLRLVLSHWNEFN